MPKWLKFTMVGLLLLAAAAIPLAMQRPTGALDGVITDETGPLAGVTVELTHSVSGTMARTVSGMGGYYRATELQRGTYSLWITEASHQSVNIPRVFVENGETAHLDVRMNSISRRSTESALAH